MDTQAEIKTITNKDISTFGAPHGLEISNKSKILKEIDLLLGQNKPPAVEYLFVYPYFRNHYLNKLQIFSWFGNYYGHSAIRYTRKNGEQVLMNVVGLPDHEMINFLSPEEYLFGTDFQQGNEQGGVYNRSIVSVRIENYDHQKIEAMHQYYMDLRASGLDKKSKFSLVFSTLWNTAQKYLSVNIAERGNCARWTSLGLVNAGLLDKPSLFPKRIFAELYERHGKEDFGNIHVVSYRKPKHSKNFYGHDGKSPPRSGLGPIMSMSHVLLFLYRY
eukprot:TRINITY_DN1061_c0_g1_i3.p1 TRINITY_DN1061_c0_g1~~TRINITY_DN1061_c0_g1_i3.p1  ORF type:complete len:274 (+),score=36.09 TRINITY_DN1061_c0_g1_i3:217-1038(+)